MVVGGAVEVFGAFGLVGLVEAGGEVAGGLGELLAQVVGLALLAAFEDGGESLKLAVQGVARGERGALLLVPFRTLGGVAVGGQGLIREQALLAAELAGGLGGDARAVLGGEGAGGGGDGLGVAAGGGGLAAESVGAFDVALGEFLELVERGVAEVGEALAEQAHLGGVEVGGRGLGGLLEALPEVVGGVADVLQLGLRAGEGGFGRFLALLAGGLLHGLHGLAQIPGFFGQRGGLLGQAACLGGPLALERVHGLLLDDDAHHGRLGFLPLQVGGDEFQQHGVPRRDVHRGERQHGLHAGLAPGFAGQLALLPVLAIDRARHGDSGEADIITGEALQPHGLVSQKRHLLLRLQDLRDGRQVRDDGDLPGGGLLIGKTRLHRRQADLPGLVPCLQAPLRAERAALQRLHRQRRGVLRMIGIDLKAAVLHRLVGLQNKPHFGALQRLQIAMILGDLRRRQAGVAGRRDRFDELHQPRPRARGKRVPGADGIPGQNAVTRVTLADADAAFVTGAGGVRHGREAAFGARGLAFQHHLAGEAPGDIGADDDFGMKGCQSAGGRRLDDGDDGAGGPLQVRKGDHRARQEARQMQRGHAAQSGDDERQRAEAERPAAQRAQRQQRAGVELPRGGGHLVLEPRAELLRLSLMPVLQLHSGEQALVQAGGGAFQQAGRAGIIARLAQMAQSRPPRGEAGARVSRKHRPGPQRLRHETRAVQQRGEKRRREHNEREAEQRAPGEQGAAAGAESLKGLAGGRAETGVHV